MYKNALTALCLAVLGQRISGEPYREPIKNAARKLVKAYRRGQAVYKNNQWLVDKNFDHAITALVGAAFGQNVSRGPYREHVYDAARNVVESYKDAEAVYAYRLTDHEEYKAERERLRQIGLTIDPAIAETMFWYADVSDPYGILDPEKYNEDCCGRVHAARSPGGKWVIFEDLPEATQKALWKRDGRKLVFPYGLHPDHEIINKPAAAKPRAAVAKK